MDPQQEFMLFLQNNPELFSISQSEFYMQILMFMEHNALALSEFQRLFPNVEKEDAELIMFSLTKAGVIETMRLPGKVIYYLSSKGREFLAKYKAARKKFEVYSGNEMP